MSNEQIIRLRLNDLHMCISDALECIDEELYVDADTLLHDMQLDIGHLREDVSTLCVRGVLVPV